MDTTRFDVFLSYRRADLAQVEAIAKQLQARDVSCFLDKQDIRAGDKWREKIQDGLKRSQACAVFIGSQGIGNWQQNEIDQAIEKHARSAPDFRVVPVFLPGVEPPERKSELPEFLLERDWVQFGDSSDDEDALQDLIQGIRPDDPAEETLQNFVGRCPYKGLAYFDVDDSPFFFGRKRRVDGLLKKLRPRTTSADHERRPARDDARKSTREQRFIGIIGASGSGKSSLVRAGLLAALRQDNDRIPDSKDWLAVVCRPLKSPITMLAQALSDNSRLKPHLPEIARLIEELQNNSGRLDEVTRAALAGQTDSSRVVIVVDQFEELFTVTSDDDERRAFLENLLHAATAPAGHTIVIVTLRADFYGSCAPYKRLAQALQESHELIPPLTREELRAAIVRPARCCGRRVDPRLTDTLLDEMRNEPAALPLLEHALEQLWNRSAEGQDLTLANLEAIGGLHGALQRHADGVYQKFTAEEQQVCRQLLVQLTKLGEQTEDTKWCKTLHDLLESSDHPVLLQQVVKRLTEQRLLSMNALNMSDSTADDIADGDGVSGEATVEVAHEALIRGWPKLREWLDEDREALLARQQFEIDVKQWVRRDRDKSHLYSGSLLRRAIQVTTELKGKLTADQDEFLNASVQLLVDKLGQVKWDRVADQLRELNEYADRALRLLKRLESTAAFTSPERLLASLALLPFDTTQRDHLADRLLTGTGDDAEFPLIRDALAGHREELVPRLWQVLSDENDPHIPRRFHAGLALAWFDPPAEGAPSESWLRAGRFLAEQLVSAVELNASRFGTLVERLRPARSALSAPLASLSGSGDSRRRSWAVTVIAELYGDQADYLYAVAAGADEQTYPLLAERLEAHASRIVELSESELARPAASGGDQESREQRELLAQRQATAAVTLLRLGRAEAAWPVFRHSPDPGRRSHLIHRVGPYGVPAALLLERLRDEPDASARRALLLSLGEMLTVKNAAHQATLAEARELVECLFREDGDAGVHGAAEWTLRRWGEESRIAGFIQERAGQPARVGQGWEVNGQGQTLVLIPGPVEFEMGSPPDEPERFGGAKESWEQQHRKRIARSYALASTPVTVEQFLRFRAEYRYVETYSPSGSHPINWVTWYEAAEYCNWLSEQEGIPRAQWCYDPKQEFAAGMRVPKNHLERRGYRLPTESEWEYACRSGTLTSRYYGESVALLRHYAWYTKTSEDQSMLAVGSLKPNDFGLFDMLGNASEWCLDVADHYQTDDAVNEDAPENKPLDNSEYRVLRGGSFMYTASGVRSAGRLSSLRPDSVSDNVAFRVARTYH